MPHMRGCQWVITAGEGGWGFKTGDLKRFQVTVDRIHSALLLSVAHMNAGKSSTEATAAKKTARAMQDAASALDILVHDYIVIAGDAYTSAREAGWLKG